MQRLVHHIQLAVIRMLEMTSTFSTTVEVAVAAVLKLHSMCKWGIPKIHPHEYYCSQEKIVPFYTDNLTFFRYEDFLGLLVRYSDDLKEMNLSEIVSVVISSK